MLFLHLHGMEYTMFAFFSHNGVLALDFSSFTFVLGRNVVLTQCFDDILLNRSKKQFRYEIATVPRPSLSLSPFLLFQF